MADSHVISALSTKRGEILGSIKHYKQLLSSLDKDLANIDATIKIFEPDYKFGSEKVVNKHIRNRFFNNGEAKVLALEVLKNSNLPISTDKIADIIAVNKNLPFENKIDKSNFQKSVLLALNTCLLNNLVENFRNMIKYRIQNILGLFMEKSFDENMPKNLIKAELDRRGLKVKDLVELLKPYGENLTDKSYNNKMTRKGFSAVFFCKYMMALGVKNLNLEI